MLLRYLQQPYSPGQPKLDLAIYFLNGLSYDKSPTVSLIELRDAYFGTGHLKLKTSVEKVRYRSWISQRQLSVQDYSVTSSKTCWIKTHSFDHG
jgi:hypothetical protein